MSIMSAREVVKKAIEFGSPEWTPYVVSCNPDQLRGYMDPGGIEALKQGLCELGATEVNGYYTAQRLAVGLGPRGTWLPEPYRPLQDDEWVDEWGVIWTNREFARVIGHPLEADWDGLSSYKLPDPWAAGRYDEARQSMAQSPDCYRLGWVWFTLFERLWFLRGFNNMLVDPYLYPAQFSELADRIVEFNLASIQQQLALRVDGIYFSDDWGSQQGLLMNPDDWRRWYKPRYRRLFDAVHAGGAHVWMHLCGNVTAIIPDLIELGLDVLNPIQPQAMDVDALAARYGGHVCFHGGLDTQETLPHGTVADVEREVKHLIDIFGRYSGGYIGTTSHKIMPETPPENILALFRAFRDYSGYEGR